MLDVWPEQPRSPTRPSATISMKDVDPEMLTLHSWLGDYVGRISAEVRTIAAPGPAMVDAAADELLAIASEAWPADGDENLLDTEFDDVAADNAFFQCIRPGRWSGCSGLALIRRSSSQTLRK